MRATFLLSMKATGADTLSDADAAAALRKLVKQRLDSIAQFTAAGRPENVAAEQAELALIESFLPQLADAATTEAWVVAAIAAVGATKPGDVGKVIGAVTKAHKGEADTAVVKAAAERLLQAKG